MRFARSPEVLRLKRELTEIARARLVARSQVAGGLADLARLEAEEDALLVLLAAQTTRS